jgi:hypothetical protein
MEPSFGSEIIGNLFVAVMVLAFLAGMLTTWGFPKLWGLLRSLHNAGKPTPSKRKPRKKRAALR